MEFDTSMLVPLFQVIMIDIALAGDNAIVIGMAASGLPKEQRNRVIFVGIVAATVLRIVFAIFTTQLLAIVGLLLVGGLLLLWVSWKLWRELRSGHKEEEEAVESLDQAVGDAEAGNGTAGEPPRKSFRDAVVQIIIADVSMSLDNVLAVAGAARDHVEVLVIGLVISIALMGLAANWIARLLQNHRWIAYVGLLVILYVAIEMTWRGFQEVMPHMNQALAGMV